jgi:hypothetical protein
MSEGPNVSSSFERGQPRRFRRDRPRSNGGWSRDRIEHEPWRSTIGLAPVRFEEELLGAGPPRRFGIGLLRHWGTAVVSCLGRHRCTSAACDRAITCCPRRPPVHAVCRVRTQTARPGVGRAGALWPATGLTDDGLNLARLRLRCASIWHFLSRWKTVRQARRYSDAEDHRISAVHRAAFGLAKVARVSGATLTSDLRTIGTRVCPSQPLSATSWVLIASIVARSIGRSSTRSESPRSLTSAAEREVSPDEGTTTTYSFVWSSR